MDVDGVLTDGGILLDSLGNEIKSLSCIGRHRHAYLHRAGIKTAILSGRICEAVNHRAKELNIEEVYQGIINKIDAYHDILENTRSGMRRYVILATTSSTSPSSTAWGFPLQ